MAAPVPVSANLLLRSLPPASALRLTRDLRVRELPLGEEVFDAGEKNDVFFPLSSVISILRRFEDGEEIEVSMVGCEGAAGLNMILGVETNPYVGLVQGPGYAAQIGGTALRRHLEVDRDLAALLQRYVYTALSQLSQLVICNRLHLVEQRLAHWILLLQDRVGADEFSLTQEFLSRMLATRRATISAAIKTLSSRGSIEHRRSRVKITDRVKLEKAACSCYSTEFDEYQRVLGFPPRTIEQ